MPDLLVESTPIHSDNGSSMVAKTFNVYITLITFHFGINELGQSKKAEYCIPL